MVADYFEVGERALNSLIRRHREELESNGFRLLTGAEAVDNQSFNLKLTQVGGHGVAIYPRRAVLNVAMLLRDSDVARRVRTHLLDTEAAAVRTDPAGPPPFLGIPEPRLGPGPHWDEYEYLQAHPGVYSPDHYAGFDLVQWIDWAFSVDRRLDAHGRVIAAMSMQLCQVGDDVRELREDMAAVRQEIAELRQGLALVLPGFGLGAAPAKRPRRRR